MILVIRAGPSPTFLRIPSIKQDDLQRRGEGPRASPLQNLFPFNGLPCLPLPSNLFLSCLLTLLLLQGTVWVSRRQNATGHTKWIKNKRSKRSGQEGRKQPQTAGAGLADVGFPRLPPGFYWGEKLIKVNNSAFGEKSERSRQWWQEHGGWENLSP